MEATSPPREGKAPKLTPEEQTRWDEHVRAIWTAGNNNTPRGRCLAEGWN